MDLRDSADLLLATLRAMTPEQLAIFKLLLGITALERRNPTRPDPSEWANDTPAT